MTFDFSEFLRYEDFLTDLITSRPFREEFNKAFKSHGRKVVRKLVSERTRGRPGLRRQSGALARSITSRTFGTRTQDLLLTINIGEGLSYGRIQEEGGVVRPKGRFLAIPMDSIRTRTGIPRFRSPRDPRLAPTFVVKFGSKLYVAKKFRSRGEAAAVLGRGRKIFVGRTTVLLFALRTQVRIPARLGAKSLFRSPEVTQDRTRIMNKALGRALNRLGIT